MYSYVFQEKINVFCLFHKYNFMIYSYSIKDILVSNINRDIIIYI